MSDVDLGVFYPSIVLTLSESFLNPSRPIIKPRNLVLVIKNLYFESLAKKPIDQSRSNKFPYGRIYQLMTYFSFVLLTLQIRISSR